MASTGLNDVTDSNQEDIDFRELLGFLWKKKGWILSVSLGCFLFAAYYANFVAKPVYVSSALLVPTQASSSSELGAAAALIGKTSSNTGDVDLYQGLMTSRTVIQKLIREKMTNESDTGKGKIEPLSSILGVDTTNALSMDNAVEAISGSISVGSRSGDGGILDVRVSAITPWLAQQLNNGILRIGQEELRLVRIERSNVIMTRLATAVGFAKDEWDSTARALTWYKDRNRSIVLPEQILALSRLEIEKQAKEQKYLLARKELETQMLEKAKAAPPMMILDPASRPSKKSKPKKKVIMIAGLLAGVFISSGALLSWKALRGSR